MCRPRGSPTDGPSPGSTCKTPRGIPASCANSATRSAVRLVCSAGLIIIEQPDASAGPIFQANIIKGKFHGKMATTTPIGSRTIIAIAPSPVGAV